LHLYYTIKALNENFQFLEVDEDFLGCEIKKNERCENKHLSFITHTVQMEPAKFLIKIKIAKNPIQLPSCETL
jgi:hypothetical protein